MTGPTFFATDLFVPEYRPLESRDWRLEIVQMGISPGYWTGPSMYSGMPLLSRGADVWMSLTPMEIESAEIGIRLARGHVVVLGLGLGWAAAATAMKDAVTRVTVVERDPDVLALHAELDLFSQLPEAARAKVQLVHGDAYRWTPDTPVDLLMPDIWLPLVNDGRVAEVREMQRNVDAASVYFWGQELELARHARKAGRALDAEGIAATAASFGLPLIGLGWPDYPTLVTAAAERWMRGRWLD